MQQSHLGWVFSAMTERGDEMILAMLERSCRAVRELTERQPVSEAPIDGVAVR